MVKERRSASNSQHRYGMRKSRLQFVVLTLSFAASSCWFKKSPAVFTPPPVAAAPPPTTTTDPASLPQPPKIEGDPNSTNPPPTPNSMPKAEGTVPPKQTKPPRRVAVTPAPPKPPGTDKPGSVEPSQPRLGQIFTPEQWRDYNRTLDESLDRVRRALEVLDGKKLNAEQKETRNRIRTFQKQAEQARQQDLVTAGNLARRADLLAKDLVERLP
jgi:hypothetical protein